MRSIEKSFINTQNKHPEWSSFICFAHSIKGRNFSEDRIKRYFNKLVDKNEYLQNEKMSLLKNLYQLAKSPEAYVNQ